MNLRWMIFLLCSIFSLSTGLVKSQSETIDMLDALDIIRKEYGELVVIESGYYNATSQCWQIQLSDSIICVSDTSGEISEIVEDSHPLLPSGALTAIGLAIFAFFVYMSLQKLNSPNIGKNEASKSVFKFSIPVATNGFPYVLGLIAGYFALQSIIARWIQSSVSDSPQWFDVIVRIVNINLEQSLPTWYATILLVLVAGLAAIIAQDTSQPHRKHWFGLAFLFTFLSIDEAISIHEELTIPLREALDMSGVFYFAWIVIGLVLVSLISLIYLRFVFNLPARIRNLTVLAGVVFVGGGIGVEAISAALYEQTGTTAFYSTIGTVEELFEMMGVIIFIRALLLFSSQERTNTASELN